MSFKDYLNQPLPSQLVKESADDVDNTEDMIDTAMDDLSDVNDDEDIDGLSDEDLLLLSKEIEDDTIDALVGDEAEIELSPEEEKEADDRMALSATSFLVNDELNAEEKANFVADEGSIAISEGFLTESDLAIMAYDLGLVEEGAYNKKMIIRLDKESKMKQLFALGVFSSAMAKNDPDYVKYKKILKMRKIYKKKLEKKYRNEAIKRMKVWWKRLTTSKSKTLKTLAKKNNVNK